MKKRITEYSQCFNQSRKNYSESNSTLGRPKPEVVLYDDFDPSYFARPNLYDDMYLHGLEKEIDLLCLYPLTLHPTLAHLRMSLMMS